MDSEQTKYNVLKIAFTGHRDVLQHEKELFVKKLTCELNKLRLGGNAPIFMYNAMAEGTDLWAAECLQNQDHLVVLDYDEDDKIRNFDNLNVNIKREFIGLSYFSQNSELKYTTIRDVLLRNCNIIIAAWDGLFIGEPGGTSDVIEKAISSKKPFTLFQLVTPRVKNPYPVAAFIDDVVSFKDKKYNRVPIALHYSFVKLTLPQKIKEFRPQKRFFKDSVFWTYLLPLGLIFFTITLGFIGFLIAYFESDSGFLNALFRAVNLLTFNESVIDVNFQNPLLNIARILGLLTIVSGASFAFYIAFKKQRDIIKLLSWRFYNNFHVVFGLNEKSFDLIKDLQFTETKNVLVIDPLCDEQYLSELTKISNMVIRKFPITSKEQMKKAYINECKHIFIFSDNESEAVRCIQEIDALFEQKSNFPDVFIQLNSEQARRFVHDSASDDLKKKLIPFDIYENTVRRLLMNYPIDRFYQYPNPNDKEEAVVFVLGYGPLGQKMVDYLMRIGHFGDKHALRIRVICENAAHVKDQFYKKHPLARANKNDDTNVGRVTKYTWQNTKLSFDEAPMSIYEYIHDHGILTKEIYKHKVVTIYALHPDGVQSAKLLNEILPRLDHLKTERQCNLQVFCYYNFPDKKEEIFLEKKFRKLAPNIFIALFGNFLDECTLNSLQNNALDALPKMINAVYNKIEPVPTNDHLIESKWQELKEEKKISNRMAADHLWVKIRSIWNKIGWENIDMETFIPHNLDQLKVKGQDEILGKLEHKRWCADLLMQNTIPVEYDATSKIIRQELTAKWVNPYKSSVIDQRYHVDLVPYELLHDDEKQKDRDQVEKIPEFLRAVIKEEKRKTS
ncbi:MAG TPA: hypothetical protein VK169_09130 [Saprospiraceae bacterium]|nr:hypothetical protein [Saprospiraceae bacterium]